MSPLGSPQIIGRYAIYGKIASGGMATMPPKPENDFRMLAAIGEGPGGNIFIRFIGPAKTIAGNLEKYNRLLSSIEKE